MWQQRLKRTKRLTSKQVGLRYGFRSGLEEQVATELRNNSVMYEFEKTKLKYVKPQKAHTYTPDFYLPKQNIYIETKGLFTTQDRQKMRLVKEQHPELDIRFVFSNSKLKLNKKSKTTYGMWCETHGFKYADENVPKEWINAK